MKAKDVFFTPASVKTCLICRFSRRPLRLLSPAISARLMTSSITTIKNASSSTVSVTTRPYHRMTSSIIYLAIIGYRPPMRLFSSTKAEDNKGEQNPTLPPAKNLTSSFSFTTDLIASTTNASTTDAKDIPEYNTNLSSIREAFKNDYPHTWRLYQIFKQRQQRGELSEEQLSQEDYEALLAHLRLQAKRVKQNKRITTVLEDMAQQGLQPVNVSCDLDTLRKAIQEKSNHAWALYHNYRAGRTTRKNADAKDSDNDIPKNDMTETDFHDMINHLRHKRTPNQAMHISTVLDDMASQGIKPTEASYIALIDALINQGHYLKSKKVFMDMTLAGIKPTSKELFKLMILGEVRSKNPNGVKLWMVEMQLRGIDVDLDCLRMLCDCYMLCGDFEKGKEVIEEMMGKYRGGGRGNEGVVVAGAKDRQREKLIWSYEKLLDQAVKRGSVELAEVLFDKLMVLGFKEKAGGEGKPLESYYSNMISLYVRRRELNKALELAGMLQGGVMANDAKIMSELVRGFAAAGQISQARAQLQKIIDIGKVPLISAFNAILDADLSGRGAGSSSATSSATSTPEPQPKSFVETYHHFMNRIAESNCKPDKETFHIFIKYVSNDPESMTLVLQEMVKHDIQPTLDTFTLIINKSNPSNATTSTHPRDQYNNNLNLTLILLDIMKKWKIIPNSQIFAAILTACTQSQNYKTGWKIITEIRDQEIPIWKPPISTTIDHFLESNFHYSLARSEFNSVQNVMDWINKRPLLYKKMLKDINRFYLCANLSGYVLKWDLEEAKRTYLKLVDGGFAGPTIHVHNSYLILLLKKGDIRLAVDCFRDGLLHVGKNGGGSKDGVTSLRDVFPIKTVCYLWSECIKATSKSNTTNSTKEYQTHNIFSSLIGFSIENNIIANTSVCNWTISTLLSQNDFNLALKLYNKMVELDNETDSYPNVDTINKFIMGCNRLKKSYTHVLGWVEKLNELGITPDENTYRSLIRSTTMTTMTASPSTGNISEYRIQESLRWFGILKSQYSIPSEESYASVIKVLLSNEAWKEAEFLMREMEQNGIKIGTFTISSLSRYKSKLIYESPYLYQFVDTFLQSNNLDTKNNNNHVTNDVYTSLIADACDKQDLTTALTLFNKMKQTNQTPDLYSYSALIVTCSNVGNLPLCRKLISDMVQDGIKPGIVALNSWIKLEAWMGEWQSEIEFEALVGKMMDLFGVVPNFVTYLSVLHGASMAGNVAGMRFVERVVMGGNRSSRYGNGGDVDGKLFIPNLSYCNYMMSGYFVAGEYDVVLKIFNRMIGREKVLPNSTSYLWVILVPMKQKDFDGVRKWWRVLVDGGRRGDGNGMTEGVEPSPQVVMKLVDEGCKMGLFDLVEELLEVVEKKKGGNVWLDALVYNTLMNNYLHADKMEDIPKTFERMVRLGISPTGGSWNIVMRWLGGRNVQRNEECLGIWQMMGTRNATLLSERLIVDLFGTRERFDESSTTWLPLVNSDMPTAVSVIFDQLGYGYQYGNGNTSTISYVDEARKIWNELKGDGGFIKKGGYGGGFMLNSNHVTSFVECLARCGELDEAFEVAVSEKGDLKTFETLEAFVLRDIENEGVRGVGGSEGVDGGKRVDLKGMVANVRERQKMLKMQQVL
ncbi:hypothetical protein HDU76_010236 [Blyttiomyces sp. JEL0837]|nr:hypothetical protein HDU76_010236 [Blyttiomyces sp. JEL0837]